MGRLIAVVVLGLCAAASIGGCLPAGATATTASSGWGKAEPVPGLGSLTAAGGDSTLNALSCASAGNCTAGGFYQIGTPTISYRAFVVSQVAGQWGQAEPVPGLAALDKGNDSQVTSVDCTSPGNCTAAGFYALAKVKGFSRRAVFVTTQVRGTWGQPRPLPGFGPVDLGDSAILSLSCSSPGNCGAGGFDSPRPTSGGGCCEPEGFVASELHGAWSKPHQVPGTRQIDSVSCPATGSCAAAGRLVLTQARGRWGKPLLVRADTGLARLTSVSCAAAGDCTAVGYLDGKVKGHLKPVAAAAASLVRGTWTAAVKIAGLPVGKPPPQETQDGPVLPNFTEVSCPKPGRCVAGGDTTENLEAGSSTQELGVAFAASQSSGGWRAVRRVTGLARLSKFRYDVVTALSCSAPGDCAIAGAYATDVNTPDDLGTGQAYVATERHGAWSPAIAVRSAAGDAGHVAAVDCPASGRCTAVGASFFPSHQEAFVLDQG